MTTCSALRANTRTERMCPPSQVESRKYAVARSGDMGLSQRAEVEQTMQMKKGYLLIGLAVSCAISSYGCDASAPKGICEHASAMVLTDRYTLAGDKHLVRDYAALDSSGYINVVVEIPTGTNAKWETDKSGGTMKWELKKGKPRVVSYLGYPGNYGMVPRTLLPQEWGGDGDPLDVLILAPPLPRGSVVKARAIGVLKMLDGGEQDDKIIAVLPDSDLGRVCSIEELRREFTGIPEIIEIWFSNYKGPGKMESKGFAGVAEAEKVIRASVAAYEDALGVAE